MHRLTAELKRPSELTQAEREAWTCFTDQNAALASPYFRREFAECCEEVRSDTRVIVARRNGAVQGFLPLQLGKIGYARPLAGPLGDVHGLIVPPDAADDPRDYLHAVGVPLFEFHSATGVRQGWRTHGECRDGAWICDVSDGFEAYLENRRKLSRSAIRNYQSRYRRLEAEAGGFEFRLDDKTPENLDRMIAMKRSQYRETRVFDVFSVGWTRALMAALMRRKSDRFEGLCSTLSVNGEVIAIHVGMASEAMTHYWFPAYDPAFSRVSPGILLLMELIRAAAEAGRSGVDLGPGNYRYKGEMGCYQMPLWSGCVMTTSAPAMLREAADTLAGGIERLPLGQIGTLPRRALRKADKLAAFYAWRVYPDIDGDTFLGPGPVGAPISNASLDALAEAGANLLVWSGPGIFTESAPFRPDPAIVEHVGDLVERCQARGLYCVIGFRTGPGRSEFTFHRDNPGDWFPASMIDERVWSNGEMQSAWVEMWRYTARVFAGQRAIAGFVPMIEPNASHAAPGFDWPFMALQLAAAIRATDPATPVLISPDSYASRDHAAALALDTVSNSVLFLHDYAPYAVTHADPGTPVRFTPDEARIAAPNASHWAIGELGVQRWVPAADRFLQQRLDSLESA
ncbi:4-beta-D-xylan xylohydrolase) (Xylan 1, partial [Durusdinium trenchii]